jgi:hypothetical protein
MSGLAPPIAAAAVAGAHRRFPAGAAFDELMDRVWDAGGGPVVYGGAPGRKVWVGFHGVRGWEDVNGHSLDFCAMALKAIVLDTDEDPPA